MNFTNDCAFVGRSANRLQLRVSFFQPLSVSYWAVQLAYSAIVDGIIPLGKVSPLLFLYPVQTLISSRSSRRSFCVKKSESSLFMRSALLTRLRSVQPKTNSSWGILYRSFNAYPILGFSTKVGKVFICERNALSSIEIALKAPIVVSIDSSGIPRPVHTAPVSVAKLSVYG